MSAVAGPFGVIVSDKDLTLDINLSQSVFSAPGVVSARGAIRPADRPGATPAEIDRAKTGVNLSGRVVVSVPAASTAISASAYLISRETTGSPARQIATTSVLLQAPTDGAFEFWYVPPGSYDLLVGLGGINQWIAFGRTAVDLRQDLHNVVVTLGPGVDVTGFVTLDGRPASPSGLQISVQTDPSTAAVMGVPAQVSRLQPVLAADGTFVIRGVFEGTYRIAVTPAQTTISVADIRQGGTSVRASGMRVSSSPTPPIEIVLSSTASAPAGAGGR
jgi:hypothetical protein